MPFAYDHNPTRVVAVSDEPDGLRVDLAFELDPDRWPWLALPPQHPVVIEKLQYFGGVTALLATRAVGEGQGSALTELVWSVGDDVAEGHAQSGVCRLLGSLADLARGVGRFELVLHDAAGVEVGRLTGAGVVFDAGDSAARRAASKAKARAAGAGDPPNFVDPESVGLPADGTSFLGPIDDGSARALVSTSRALHPAHPFHTGSGDHVNAGHLLDVVLQFAHLVMERPTTWTAGTARFGRFVELDVPFTLSLHERRSGPDHEALVVAVHQLDRPCAVLEGRFQST